MDKTVHQLRHELARALSLPDRYTAFVQLGCHPEITWKDLVDGIEVGGIIAESAALCLHRKLGIQHAVESPQLSSEFWRRELASRGLDLLSACGPCWKTASGEDLSDKV